MNERLQKLFEMMMSGKKVRISSKLRDEWIRAGAFDLGQWFDIRNIDCFGEIEIQSKYHTAISGIKINEIIF